MMKISNVLFIDNPVKFLDCKNNIFACRCVFTKAEAFVLIEELVHVLFKGFLLIPFSKYSHIFSYIKKTFKVR